MRSGKSFCLTLHWVGIRPKRPSVRMSRLISSRRRIFERSWKELPVLMRLRKSWESIPLPFIERESGCSFELMLRLKLTLGLLATLLILLLVGIYGVWLFNDLGRAVGNVLRDNYDSIKVCHYIRTSTARVNTFYARGERPSAPLDRPSTLEAAEKDFHDRLPILERNAKTAGDKEVVADLKTTY